MRCERAESGAKTLTTGSIPSSAYTREYYESCCAGYREFASTQGHVLPLRLQIPLRLAAIEPEMSVLDIGCGRGELLLHVARQGASAHGLDYAQEACVIARGLIDEGDVTVRDKVAGLLRANGCLLPYADRSFDRVFLLDIVEHLYPEELRRMFLEVRRVMKPKGRAVIHTMPNLWYYRYGYPLYRLFQRMRKLELPADPRERWAYHHVHVNEQTPRSLRKVLRRAGFLAQVWLLSAQEYDNEPNRFVRAGMGMVVRLYPLRLIFCNDIFALAVKP